MNMSLFHMFMTFMTFMRSSVIWIVKEANPIAALGGWAGGFKKPSATPCYRILGTDCKRYFSKNIRLMISGA
jgi:hypothetical protein